MMDSTRVFMSYRREDSKHVAARIAERLDNRFKLFMDIDVVRPGMDFTSVVRKAIGESDLLLAVIGPQWISATDASGHRRLDDPNDWVVAEIGSALQNDIAVIPILVDGAQMPTHEELPATLAELANRQALTISHESFAADSARLISVIEDLTRTQQAATASGEQRLFSDEEYMTAAAAYFEEQWPTAIEHLERVLSRYPDQPHVTERLTHARLMNRLDEVDGQAVMAAEEGRWRDAVNALEQLNARDPEFRNARERLESARRRLRIFELQAYIQSLAAAGQWTDLLDADAEIAKLDRSAANPDGLADRARRELEEADLSAKYAAGLQELNRGNWQGALEVLSAVVAKRPNYRDANRLVSLARARMSPLPAAAPGVASPNLATFGSMPSPNPPPPIAATMPGGRRGRKRTSKILLVVGVFVVVLAIGLSVLMGFRSMERADPMPIPTQSIVPEVSPSNTSSAPEPDTTTTPSPDASGTFSSAEELRSHLPADFRDDCEEAEVDPTDERKPGLIVFVACSMSASTDPDFAHFYQYETQAALTKALRSFTGPPLTHAGSCDKGEHEGGWTLDQKDMGTLACYVSEGGSRVFVWTHDDLKILSVAGSKKLSYANLYKWWQYAGPE